jgi:hypothetical protein
LARLAIFNGQADQAKKYVDEAKASITKAEADDTAFIEAEAGLKPPAGVSQRSATQGARDRPMQSAEPTAWLPVDRLDE